MLVNHQSRSLKRSKRYGKRSRSLSPSKNLKRRINARRLVAFVEEENIFKENWQFFSKACIGLRGGAKNEKRNVEILDQARFFASIRYAKLLEVSSKKHFWKTVARQYFGYLRVSKRKIGKLRLFWRRNEGGVREKFNRSHQDEDEANSKPNTLTKSVKTEDLLTQLHFDSDNDSESTSDDDVIGSKIQMPEKRSTMGINKRFNRDEMTEFLGNVIGSTISSVYRKNFIDQTEYQRIKKPTPRSQDHFCSSEKMNKPSSFHSASQSKYNIVKDLSSDDCLSYEQVKHTDVQDNKFLNIPNVSGVTAMSLSSSNVPSSGTFRAKLSKDVCLVSLPSAWRDIRIKNITDKKRGMSHRAFDAGYTSFFSDILKQFNPYCCWIFKRNYIKKEYSRKISSPYWCGMATCKFGDVSVHLKIEDRGEGMLEIRFTGDVCHDITSAKAKKITGSDRGELIEHAWKSNQEPSKMHSDQLLRVDSESFSAGIRTGAGLTHGTMKGIKSEAKARHQSDHHLTKSLSELHDSIGKEEENKAISLGHTWRKFFGYIQMCSMSPDINIVLFNEASVRLYHELSRHDIIYIDATGNLFANEKTHSRLLYYAMVLRNPFPQNSPIPIAEYITSRHTADSIGMMIRKLKEREKEVFSKEVIPVLVMSDFSMAIIIACLKEFNNESVEEYFERGYRIVTGKATQKQVHKTIHHVCSAHMMQIIKRHARTLCEKGYPAGSQIHIAMRFFGRLVSASSLNEMKIIVNLGYVIFKTKHVCATLTEKLEQFSENIRTFNTHNDDIDEENVSDNESHPEENMELSDDECDTMNDVVIGPCSVKQFWEEELDNLTKTSSIKESGGDNNKYYMPRFFDYVAKNYLPSCLLWSNLLLGDLIRYNSEYSLPANLLAGPKVRSYLTDNQTNGEIEDFFKIKKNCSFKGQRHLRLDTFIGENWKDNLALQREFIDAIVKQGINIRKPTLKKLQNLCSSTVKKSPDSPDHESSSSSEKSTDQCSDEFMDNVTLSEEQWQKPSPYRSAKKKGKYLNPSGKKLNFNPLTPQKKEQKVNDPSPTSFEEYERSVWIDVSSRVHGYRDIKKEIKKLWSKYQKEQKKPKQEKMDGVNRHRSKDQEDLISATHCICRQKRNTSAVSCILCNEIFHCDCVDFCTGLAKLSDRNYFCTNCIYKTFVPFACYIVRSTLPTSHFNRENVSRFYDEFSVNVSHTSCSNSGDMNEPGIGHIMEGYIDIPLPVIAEPNGGIRNTESNCWLSSALQCLATTPLCELLEKYSKCSEVTSMLIYDAVRTLKFLASTRNRNSVLRLENGPGSIAAACGMIPNKKEHKDSSEFLNLFLNRIYDQLPVEGKQELERLFKLTTLELNRCLVPTCCSLNGKTNTVWNIMLQIPISLCSIRLQSLLWTRVYGRFSTEEDEVCNKCADGKPVVHHSELGLSIPYIFTLTIHRTTADNQAKIHTPIICDEVLNLRGIDADHFDEKDINYNLRAAILHKGPSIRFGHFVSCVFNSDNTAFVYDDEAVNVVKAEHLVKSNDFSTSVYMCFYVRREERIGPECGNDENVQPEFYNVPWQLSKRAHHDVEKIWSYKKELFYGNDKISSHHLKTLRDGNWLSGDVVNSFLNRIGNNQCPNSRLHIFQTYLYTALSNYLREGGIVSKALSLDPLSCNMLMFPINTSDHWSLLICYPNSSMLVYYDSLLVVNVSAFIRVVSLIKAMFSAHSHKFDLKRWLLLAPNDIPSQDDSCSCGVFMCVNAYIMAKDDELNYSSQDITQIRKWLVNFLVQESLVSRERQSKNYHHIETNALDEVPLKSSDILRTIPTNDDLDKSPFQRIKILARSRAVSESEDTHTNDVEINIDVPTTSYAEPSQQPGEASLLDQVTLSNQRFNLRRRSKLKRKYRSSEYDFGSPVLEADDAKVDSKDVMWKYDEEKGLLANHPNAEVQVERSSKQSGYKLWKEDRVKNRLRGRKRLKEDLESGWKDLDNTEKRHWKSLATMQNKGFSFRWKNIWDDGFPGKWINFLKSHTSDAQNRLRNAIRYGPSTEGNTDPYVKMCARFYQKYNVQTWCEMPADSTWETMFSSFMEQCADPVLKDLGLPTMIPSSVLNKVDDEFFNLINMYMVFLTRAPLGLALLCRMVLSRKGSQELIRLFKSITSSELRECLFHIIQHP